MDEEQAEGTDDDGPVDWLLDRPGTMVWWSGPQLSAMSVLAEPSPGATLCRGRVAVRLDGTWRCTSHCNGGSSTFHPESAVDGCSAPESPSCLCWNCLETSIPFVFSIYGDFDQEWRRLLSRISQATPEAVAGFVRRCDARSSRQPDAERVFTGVEEWLRSNGMQGLVDRYPTKIIEGSYPWSLERAVCAAAALLERDSETTLDSAGPEGMSEAASAALVSETFESLWADLTEACGYPGQIASLVMILVDAPMGLEELLATSRRAGA